jgi:site-specific DNA-methyltransferase (adenine-specific)
MIMKDSERNKGLRLETKRKDDARLIFSFNTEQEQDNFLNYLKTDFARFCLSMYKVHSNQRAGALNLIPWLDFTEEWDDDKLFAKFDVSQELQDYIRDFLPDYYGIRK